MQRLLFNNIPITSSNKKEINLFIKNRFNNVERNGILITFVNTHVFCISQNDRELQKILNNAEIVLVDGILIVIAMWITKGIRLRRCIMTEVFDEFIITENIPPCKGILIGTTDYEVSMAREEINKISKKLKIVEAYSGFYPTEYYIEVFKKHFNTELVLIGLSTPKSEFLCEIAKSICSKAIIWHIGGGTIKMYAGTKKRAPEVMKRYGIEWIHRFYFERHTRKRYFKESICLLYFFSCKVLRSIANLFKPQGGVH